MGQCHCKEKECEGGNCKGLEFHEDTKEVYFVTGSALCRMIGREIDCFSPSVEKSKTAGYYFSKPEIERILEDLKSKQIVLSDGTAEHVMKKVDKAKKGKISREQFHDWIHAQCMFDKDNLFKLFPDSVWLDTIATRAFKSADSDGKGFIDPRELKNYVDAVIKQLGVEDAEDVRQGLNIEISRTDKDKDAQWSKAEFRNIVKALIVEMYISAGHAKGICP
eukprot:gnl/MRDRNA2_/MRDRNA2_14335_c0_seq1.p1 gnl/MRDRNA2_/MRDRNA2_14335_c0~~gnl/MRDRNA2_/MRDRNA2_14335_c0_seq1.p1  ORF type:complete len:221 (-),score=46.66 gnl/MRDRNA2_/MRDRNA2_14335_c0_seq1:11-673(-)